MGKKNMLNKEKKPEIIVFAGPNGSGKSTVTKMAKVIEPYINADDIKASIQCDDLTAAQKATQMREEQVLQGKSFSFETVLSTERNLRLLKKERANHLVWHHSQKKMISQRIFPLLTGPGEL